jgi:AcrR family transcriptional regulator
LSIDDIAGRIGCSRATVYRHVGGKRQLRDGVLARSIARIGAQVAAAVDGLAGEERVVQAILVSLTVIRADVVASTLLEVAPGKGSENRSLLQSPRLAAAAAELSGLTVDDPVAAAWVVRVVLALLFWPIGDAVAEEMVVRRFVAPAMAP